MKMKLGALVAFVGVVLMLPADGRTQGDGYDIEDMMRLREEQAGSFAQADKELNQTWRSVQKGLSKESKAALLESQRAWLKFRDANCKFFLVDRGTMGRDEAVSCKTDMTTARTQQLKQMVADPNL